MASVYLRGSKFWMRVKVDGRWVSKPTPYRGDERSDAERYAAEAQRILGQRSRSEAAPPKLADLPAVKTGAFGWAVHFDASSAPAICWYAEDAERRQAICQPSESNDEDRWTVERKNLRALPGWFAPPLASYPSTRNGWLYAVALTPEVDLRRLKVGWTTRRIQLRLKAYRTTNPRAMLLALWDADHHQEQAAHAAVDGRIGTSEVFQCDDPWAAIARIDEALRGGP